MISSVVSMPKFRQNQDVRFIGGEGKVKELKPESGSWWYKVEMAMGPMPDMGRIGYETTIVLPETDLDALEGDFWVSAVG